MQEVQNSGISTTWSQASGISGTGNYVFGRYKTKLLKEGKLLTLADSRYVLLEFLPGTAYSKIFSAVRQMEMAGYVPILAHVERYHVLREEGRLEELAGYRARTR